MPPRPSGKNEQAERVTFTKPAAERIAKAVRSVESGDRSSSGATWGTRFGGDAAKAIRICTFTGSWSINATKAVTFKYQSTTPNTVTATNLFFPVGGASTRDCAIARDGTAWFLVDVPLETASFIAIKGTASVSRLTDMTIAATLNTTSCTITVAKTAVTASQIAITLTATATYLQVKE